MKFINEISISDIISLVTLLATFFTILLFIQQRRDYCRPLIVIKSENQYNEFYTFKIGKEIGKEYVFDKDLKINLLNLGNGVAEDVSITVNSKGFDESLDNDEIIVSKDIIKIFDEDGTKILYRQESKLHFSYIGINESNFIGNVIQTQIKVIFAYLKGSNLLDVIQKKELPYVSVDIKYNDILGKNVKVKYKICIDLLNFIDNKQFYFFLISDKI